MTWGHIIGGLLVGWLVLWAAAKRLARRHVGVAYKPTLSAVTVVPRAKFGPVRELHPSSELSDAAVDRLLAEIREGEQ